MSVEIAMQWNTGYTESVHTFANTINTHEGGTHEEGFRAALTTLVNKFAREWGMLKEKDPNLTGDDVREGLTAIVSVKLGEPQFEGQTKTKLGNTEAKTFVRRWSTTSSATGSRRTRRGQGHRPQGGAGAACAHRGPQGPRPRPQPQGPARSAAACPASSRLPVDDPRSARSSSSRATPPAARRSAAATRAPRRSCRSAARSSTSRRPASTRCWQNNEVQAIISALRHRHPRRLRHRTKAALPQDRADGRRRRRRPAHPHAAAHAAVPVHAPLIEAGYVYLAQPPLYKIKWSQRDEHEFAYSDRERDALIEAGLAPGKRLPKETRSSATRASAR
jgi:DNA gyrase subunit B